MGGSVSSGRNNEELVDNLVEVELIKTQSIERVFRAVDRGLFYLPEHRENAYRDLAWREGHIHISAPCIYTRVMESLELRPGQSFLNVGGGTGYLSSMAGLILGAHGVNDYVEIHQSLCEYARQRVSEFVKQSPYFDHFEFCAPRLVHGNIFGLVDQEQRYDRIYVGAAVTEPEQEEFIKSLLKRDGVLIMPVSDHLVKVRRVEGDTFESNHIMSVSYASLVPGELDTPVKTFKMPSLQPYSLQELCRFRIRQAIRDSIRSQLPDYYKIERFKSTFNKDFKTKKEMTSSEDDDDDEMESEHESDDETEQSTTRRPSSSRQHSLQRDIVDAETQFLRRPGPNSSFRVMVHNLEDQTVQNSIRSLLFATRSNEEPVNSSRQQSSKEIDIPGTCRSQSNEETAFSASSSELVSTTVATTTTTTNENNLSLGESGFGDYEETVSSLPSSPPKRIDNRNKQSNNLMHQRIMQLPLSLQVKQFLLYERRDGDESTT